MENFNEKFRDECLNQNWLVDLRDAQEVIEAWRVDYNTVRAAQFAEVLEAGRVCRARRETAVERGGPVLRAGLDRPRGGRGCSVPVQFL